MQIRIMKKIFAIITKRRIRRVGERKRKRMRRVTGEKDMMLDIEKETKDEELFK